MNTFSIAYSRMTSAWTDLFLTRMNSVVVRRDDDAYLFDLIERISHPDMQNKTRIVQSYMCNELDLDHHTHPMRSHAARALQCGESDVEVSIVADFKRNLAQHVHVDHTVFDNFWYIFVDIIVADRDDYNTIEETSSISAKEFHTCFTREKFLIRKAKQCGQDVHCPICLDKFKSCQVVAKTLCNHRYHIRCLQHMCKSGISTCPLCRTNLLPQDA